LTSFFDVFNIGRDGFSFYALMQAFLFLFSAFISCWHLFPVSQSPIYF